MKLESESQVEPFYEFRGREKKAEKEEDQEKEEGLEEEKLCPPIVGWRREAENYVIRDFNTRTAENGEDEEKEKPSDSYRDTKRRRRRTRAKVHKGIGYEMESYNEDKRG